MVMSVLVLIVLAGVVVAAAAVPSGPPPTAGGQLEQVHRRTQRWRLAGLAVGLGAAAWTATTGSLGRGAMLAVPVGALCVLAGVVVGELRVTAPDRAVRSATLEVRRVRDYLPPRLTALTTAALGWLVAVLAWTTAVGSADDLGRAGRVLARQCTPLLSEARGPWPGAYYSLPLLLLVSGGVLVGAMAFRLVVRRPRQDEGHGIDDALRERAARSIVAAIGLLVAVPAAGVALVAAIVLAGSSCPAGWHTPVALLLGASVPAMLALAGWCGVVLLAPTRLRPVGSRPEATR